jgi:hypothetical protein
MGFVKLTFHEVMGLQIKIKKNIMNSS